jgi:hypothetical protein
MRINVFKFPRLVILLITIKFFASCTPESCLEETTSFVNATFYKSGTNKLTPPDSITVFGIGKDTDRLYSKSLNTTTIRLPLDASSEICGFVMKINNVTDTIKFIYSGYPHLISKECGITFFYSLDTALLGGNAVNTIKIINKNITTFNAENIQIYY